MSTARRIAVVGGGIGGLAAAAFLHRAGLKVTVYEQAASPREIGAGLIAAPNAARLIRRLPAATPLEDVGVALQTGWQFRRWADGAVLFSQQLGDACLARYGEHTWTLHRADLRRVLASALPPGTVRAGRRCTGVTQDGGGVTLSFAAGAPARADAVIAADGIHSVLRGMSPARAHRAPRGCARGGRWCAPARWPRWRAGRCMSCGSGPATTWCTTRCAAASW